MTRSAWHRLDDWSRRLTPFALTLALVLVNVIPLQIPGYPRVAPLLPLIAVYHWAIYRPDLMPAVAVFLIGVAQDVLWGTPIGVNTLVLPLVYWSVLSQRRFFAGKPFAMVWLGFALVGAGAELCSWVLVSVLAGQPVGALAPAVQFLLTAGLFPLVSRLFLNWQQSALRAG